MLSREGGYFYVETSRVQGLNSNETEPLALPTHAGTSVDCAHAPSTPNNMTTSRTTGTTEILNMIFLPIVFVHLYLWHSGLRS
jgi:hypothetical protein